jgi:DNA-binding transcriptional LysR family regulator
VNGNINLAAQRLNLTQPAVSKQLSGLESALQIKLFHRGSGRTVTPTSEGVVFYKTIEPTLENLGNLSTIASEAARHARPRLRFGAPPPILNSPPIIQALFSFRQAHPDVFMSLEQRTRIELEDWVASRQIDLAFGLLPVENPHIVEIPMIETEAVVVVRPDHRLASRKEVNRDELLGEPLILPSRQLLRSHIDAGLREMQNYIIAETTSSLTCPVMAASGIGVAVCDPFSVSMFPIESVVTVRLRPTIPLSYGVLHSKTTVPDEIIENLVGFLKKSLEGCDQLP